MVRKDRRARGWNKQNLAATDRLAAAGRRMGFEVDVDHGLRPGEQDFSFCLPELIGAEEFMAWREQGDAINLKAKDHQRELGQWIVVGEDMKAIAGEVADQRFKHSVYAAAA